MARSSCYWYSILKMGNTSVLFHQESYQDAFCVAIVKMLIVHVNIETKGSVPLSAYVKEVLYAWLLPQNGGSFKVSSFLHIKMNMKKRGGRKKVDQMTCIIFYHPHNY